MATKKTGKFVSNSPASKAASVKKAAQRGPRAKTSINFVRSVRGR